MIEFRDDHKVGCFIFGFLEPGGNFSALPLGLNAATAPVHHMTSTKLAVIPPCAQPQQRAYTEARNAVEFGEAVNYICKIKGNFSAHETVLKRFLYILQLYVKERGLQTSLSRPQGRRQRIVPLSTRSAESRFVVREQPSRAHNPGRRCCRRSRAGKWRLTQGRRHGEVYRTGQSEVHPTAGGVR